jgi:hypothetical protein
MQKELVMNEKPNWITTKSTDELVKAIDDARRALKECSRDNRIASEELFRVDMQLENAQALLPMHLLQMPGPGLVQVRLSGGGIAIDMVEQADVKQEQEETAPLSAPSNLSKKE